eukprot:18999-Pyramimonas_sp.AAC.1
MKTARIRYAYNANPKRKQCEHNANPLRLQCNSQVARRGGVKVQSLLKFTKMGRETGRPPRESPTLPDS